ncbi:hypothetical protein CUMW_116250, partial [Citrus unshiu]
RNDVYFIASQSAAYHEIINSQPAKRKETERARERERQTQRTRKERDNGEIKKEIKAQRFFTGKLVGNGRQQLFSESTKMEESGIRRDATWL